MDSTNGESENDSYPRIVLYIHLCRYRIIFGIQINFYILCADQENQANLELWSKNPLAELSQLLLLLLIMEEE